MFRLVFHIVLVMLVVMLMMMSGSHYCNQIDLGMYAGGRGFILCRDHSLAPEIVMHSLIM